VTFRTIGLQTRKKAVGDIDGASLLKQISPVAWAWQHINLYGNYAFCEGSEAIKINEFVHKLAEIKIQQVQVD